MQLNKSRNFPRLVFIMKKLFKNEKKIMKIKKRLEKVLQLLKKGSMINPTKIYGVTQKP